MMDTAGLWNYEWLRALKWSAPDLAFDSSIYHVGNLGQIAQPFLAFSSIEALAWQIRTERLLCIRSIPGAEKQ